MTRELLSEVLECEIHQKDITIIDNNVLYYTYDTEFDIVDENKITTYELAHLCKEWASKQQFKVGNSFGTYSLASYKDVQYGSSYVCFNNWRNIDAKMPTFTVDTEPEAIFQATQWILKQKRIEL